MAQPTWPADYRQNVTVGGTPANSRITKTGGFTDTFDAVARIQETWTGAGYIECTLDAADKAWFGLTSQTTVAGLLTVANWVHSLQVLGFATVNIYTNAGYVSETTQPTGQRNTWKFEVFDSGGGVYKARISLNGSIVYTYTPALTLPVSAGVMLADSSTYADALTISGAVAPNQAPTVNAGFDQTIAPGATATLDGTVSDDGLPSNSLSYAWTKVSGPGTVTFGNAALVDTTATFGANGTYVLRLTVSDGALSTSDDVTITVIPTPTQPIAPLVYDLRSDSTVSLIPAELAIGAKGSTVVDPDFDTTIMRMTDATSAASGVSWGTTSGPASNMFSADDAYCFAVAENGSTHKVFAFNPVTGHYDIEDHDFDAGSEMTFARPISRRTKLYGTLANNSLLLKEYDVLTRTWATIYDLKTDVADAVAYQQACYSSHTPHEYIVVAFNGVQETYRYVTIVNPTNISDRFTIDCSLAKVKVGGGAWTALLNHDGSAATINFGLHSTNIDRTGTWVHLGPSGSAAHMVMFNTQTQRIHEVTDNKWLGHYSFGYEQYVNASGLTIGHQWLFTDLTQGGTLSTYRTLISPAQTPGDWNLTDHNNWNNARSDALVPFITETQTVQAGIGDHGATPANAANWNALWEEVALIATATGKTAGTDAYYRVCHHRMRQVDANGHYIYTFQDSPRVQINHGGTYAIFTSNWWLTLGTYGSAAKSVAGGWATDTGYPLNHRRDLFGVRLTRVAVGPTPIDVPTHSILVRRQSTQNVTIQKGETIVKLEIYRGAAKNLVVTLDPVEDISGWTIGGTYRKSLDGPALGTLTGTVLTSGTGVFSVPLTPVGLQPKGEYILDVWRTNDGAEEPLVLPTEIKVLPSVTHP